MPAASICSSVNTGPENNIQDAGKIVSKSYKQTGN